MNNEQGKILYATFLPVLVLVLIFLGAGWFLLKGELKLPKIGRDATEIRRLEGFPTIASDTIVQDKQRLIIKSQEELSEFLNQVDPANRIVMKEDINFDKEILIASATETKDMYGYDMKIKKVAEDEESGELLVTVIETRPGEFCDEDRVPNIALDIVALKKTDAPIEFERLTETNECEEPNI